MHGAYVYFCISITFVLVLGGVHTTHTKIILTRAAECKSTDVYCACVRMIRWCAQYNSRNRCTVRAYVYLRVLCMCVYVRVLVLLYKKSTDVMCSVLFFVCGAYICVVRCVHVLGLC